MLFRSQLSKRGNKKEKKSNLGKSITKMEAETFVRNYHYPAITSISIFASRNGIVSFEDRKTTPDVVVFGGDENYLLLNGFTLADGRNFNRSDIQSGGSVVILGYDVAKKLFRAGIEKEVRYANITIIEGIGASQYGIGMVCARIAEIVLRDERAVIPIGVYNSKLGVTLSLPSVVGREGCLQVLDPPLSDDERIGLKKGIETLRKAQERIR